MRFPSLAEMKRYPRISVDFEVANNADLAMMRAGRIGPGSIRRVKLRGLVDCRIWQGILPKDVIKHLGIVAEERIKIVSPGRRSRLRPLAEGVHLELNGRDIVFHAIVAPKGDRPIIGRNVLVALDLLVDANKKRLVPRNPKHIVVELG